MTPEERLEICKNCPLCKKESIYGPVCDSSKYMNLETGQTSRLPHSGWIRGCGCRLAWRTKNLTAHCVAGKW